MKDKRSSDDEWYKPWVIKPDPFRTQHQSRLLSYYHSTKAAHGSSILKNRSSSSTRLQDIAGNSKLELLPEPPPNRMTAGYSSSMAHLNHIPSEEPPQPLSLSTGIDRLQAGDPDHLPIAFDRSQSTTNNSDRRHQSFTMFESGPVSLNQSFDSNGYHLDQLDPDEASLHSLPITESSSSPLFTRLVSSATNRHRALLTKTLSLPYKQQITSEGQERPMLSLTKSSSSSLISAQTGGKNGRPRRCPSPHSKVANGVFLNQQSEGTEGKAFRVMHNRRRPLMGEYLKFILQFYSKFIEVIFPIITLFLYLFLSYISNIAPRIVINC